MNCTAEIKVDDKSGELLRALSFKDDSKNDRSSFTVSKDSGCVVIKIVAKDATALRAAANSVAKLLIVFEKSGSIKEA